MNLDLGLMPGEWANEAACKKSEWPDAFHPGDNATNSAQMTAYAISICRTCPVVAECLSFAVKAGPTSCLGIWGATTQDQRKHMWKARGATA